MTQPKPATETPNPTPREDHQAPEPPRNPNDPNDPAARPTGTPFDPNAGQDAA